MTIHLAGRRELHHTWAGARADLLRRRACLGAELARPARILAAPAQVTRKTCPHSRRHPASASASHSNLSSLLLIILAHFAPPHLEREPRGPLERLGRLLSLKHCNFSLVFFGVCPSQPILRLPPSCAMRSLRPGERPH